MPPSRARLALLSTVVLAAALAPAVPQPTGGPPEPHGAGIAVIASSIGDGTGVAELLAFVEEARIREVVVDWAWITRHWERTRFDRVDELVRSLEKRGVAVAAMYRPRFKPDEIAKHPVAYQVEDDGSPRNGACEIRYSDAEARRWGTAWAVRILERCPALREIVIYNPTQACRSEEARAGREADPEHDVACVRAFLRETRKAMRKVRPDARLGLVLPPGVELYEPYRGVVDTARPFVFVREGADAAEDLARAREVMRRFGGGGAALAKITWGEGERVSDEWLAGFLKAARERGVPFDFWTFRTAFCEGAYDLDPLCAALGLDPAAIRPRIRDLGGVSGLAFDPEVVARAVREAADDVSAEHYRKMLDVAARFGEEAVEPLCRILDDPEERMDARWRAAGTLGSLRSTRAVDCLLRNSRDTADMVRWLCAEALGRCGAGRAEVVRRLVEMAAADPAWHEDPATGDRVHYVRETARKALDELVVSLGWAKEYLATLPFVGTLEEALGRARAEGRLAIVFLNAFDWPQFEAGWAGAREEAEEGRLRGESPDGSDTGLLKERMMLLGLTAEPGIAAELRDRAVLVCMRLRTTRFSPLAGAGPGNPLRVLGLRPADVGAPTVVVCSSEGRVLAQASRLAFFAPEILHALLDTGGTAPDSRPDDGAPRRADREAALLSAESELLGGRPAAALALLEDRPPRKADRLRHAALLAEARLRCGDPGGAIEAAERTPADDSPWGRRLRFFAALALDRTGRIEEARGRFRELVLSDGGGPWVARASAYLAAEGGNPREWWPFGAAELPEDLRSTERWRNAPEPAGPDPAGLLPAVRRAAALLLERRRPDGAWEGPRAAAIPEGRSSMADLLIVPRTALCAWALEAARPHLDREAGKRAADAVAAGRGFVQRYGEDPGGNIWDLTYALAMEMRFYPGLRGAEQRAARDRVRNLVKALAGLERNGGWTYSGDPERQHTFNTAPVLLALARVEEHDLAPVAGMLARGKAFLEEQRLGDTCLYHYGSKMQHLTSAAQPSGSSMRSPLCELALREAGAGDDGRLRDALDLFFRHLDDVRSTAKVWESHFEPSVMHDSYHYFFGTWYGAQAIATVEDSGLRKDLAGRLVRAVLATEELDGGYVDSQIQSGRCCSTALAILTLTECGEAIR